MSNELKDSVKALTVLHLVHCLLKFWSMRSAGRMNEESGGISDLVALIIHVMFMVVIDTTRCQMNIII